MCKRERERECERDKGCCKWLAKRRRRRAVWPDGEIKSSQSVSKNCPKSSITSLNLKAIVFTTAHQKSPNIWATFVAKKFQNRPIWSHCRRGGKATLSVFEFQLNAKLFSHFTLLCASLCPSVGAAQASKYQKSDQIGQNLPTFGQISKYFGNFFGGYLIFGKMRILLWQI